MIVVGDSGPLISLAVIDKLTVLEKLYGNIYIPPSVWQEIAQYIEFFDIPEILSYKDSIVNLQNPNQFIDLMDRGESEAVSLYQEINADFLLIDDKATRRIAETFFVRCIGTLAVLIQAHKQGLVTELRPLFINLLDAKRFYKKSLLNMILDEYGEQGI
jgi:predicted nucleic acid-binding protein